MVEYDKEIDRVVWKNAKHEIFFWEPIFGTGEGASEYFAWKFGKRVIPVVKWIKVTKEVYDTYEEVEKIREKYKHCGWLAAIEERFMVSILGAPTIVTDSA